LIKKILLFISLFVFCAAVLYAQDIIKKGNSFYLSNTVVVKFKTNAPSNSPTLNKSFSNFSNGRLTRLFPQQAKLNKGEESLSRIYLFEYNSPEDPIDAAAKLSKRADVEWAEPKYIQTVAFTPNDSLFILQKNLERVKAKEAWDIVKGDTTVIIAIVDTGVDYTHPDLIGNLWYEQGNFVGYDFGGLDGTPDNNPSEDYSAQNKYHGTHVAGIACAVTNNNYKGIASLGYNCSFLPVKVARSDKRDANGLPYIYYGYEGIKYAADHKANVINCSWGGPDYSNLGQETINYALSKQSLVVAAAGNNSELANFYPASYKGVLSVGWLQTDNDTISVAANYGRTVDVFAPGSLILSTWQRGNPFALQYNAISGSSMSSPLVAGLAGLIWAQFSNPYTRTPLQVAEQIRVTADDIEQSNKSTYKNLLGRGRINAYRAVTETNTKSIRATDVKFIDEGNKNGRLESGEEVSIQVTFTNYLLPVSNINVQMVSDDNSVSLINQNFSINQMAALDTVNNLSNKFRFKIQPNAPLNYELNFLLKFTANGYSDFQWISTRINTTFETHNIGRISMSVTSKGALGFNDYPNNQEGVGFKFNGGDNLLFEGALMYGTSSTTLMDAARVTSKQSTDFIATTPMKFVFSNQQEQAGITTFIDKGDLGIETNLSTYTYSSPQDDNYIILKTNLKNNTANTINNLYVGYYFDWDLPADNPQKDSTYYNSTFNLGIVVDKSNAVSTYVGAALISSNAQNQFGYYPIDNNATAGEIILNDSNGFSDAEKWISLSRGTSNQLLKSSDVSFVISGGPYSIQSTKSIDVGFAIAAGPTFNELVNAIMQSKIKYPNVRTDIKEEKNIPSEFKLFQNYPNPFNGETVISWQIAASSYVTLKVYDLLGREIVTLVDEFQNSGIHNSTLKTQDLLLPSGVYFYQLRTGNASLGTGRDFVETKRMILLK
jgi:subtilisin family serine protease